MSKSIGNIVTLREVLDTYGRDAILVLLRRCALAQSDRVLGRCDGERAVGRRASAPPSGWPPSVRVPLGRVRSRARRRLQHSGGPRPAARVASRGAKRPARARAGRLRSRESKVRMRRPSRCRGRRRSAKRHASEGTSRAPTASRRDRRDRLGSSGRRRRLPACAEDVTVRETWSTGAGPCARSCARASARSSSCWRPSVLLPRKPGFAS